MGEKRKREKVISGNDKAEAACVCICRRGRKRQETSVCFGTHLLLHGVRVLGLALVLHLEVHVGLLLRVLLHALQQQLGLLALLVQPPQIQLLLVPLRLLFGANAVVVRGGRGRCIRMRSLGRK